MSDSSPAFNSPPASHDSERHNDRDAVSALRVPPSSLEAEQAVLGGLLLDNGKWDEVAERVNEEDFYRPEHKLIFKAILQLAAHGHPADVVTLTESLSNAGSLEEAGGMVYLGHLVNNTPSVSNIKAYAGIVHEQSVLRQLITVAGDIADSAYQPAGRKTSELLDFAEQRVFQIAEQGKRNQKGFHAIKDVLADVVDRIDTLFEQDNPITGLPTGFSDFDTMTSGLQDSDMVIVAGRPSMGKTTFAMNIAEHAAIKAKKPVAVFSMEMPAEQLAMRMMSSLGRIDQSRLRTGRLEDEDWPRLTSAVGMLAETPLFIDDTPAMSPTELRSRARRLKREQGDLGLIVIDYLQLMQLGSSGGRENRAAEISEISRSLKSLAKELSVPIIALSQLNRSLEQRPNKRPVMSDLRESGAIEQDADLIVFIYRDEVYNDDSEDKGTAEIIIGKQRNGPIGTVRLTFLGQFTRFENFAPFDEAEDFG